MIQEGKVIGYKGGMLEICFERPEACKHCGACGEGKHHATVQLPGEASIGSRILVDMPERKVLRASLLAYVVPLLLLLLGIALGTALFHRELYGALCGLALMGLSYLVLKCIEKKVGSRPGWRPQIIAVYDEGGNKHGTETDEG